MTIFLVRRAFCSFTSKQEGSKYGGVVVVISSVLE